MASPGADDPDPTQSPIGARRPKSGATLAHVIADAEHWHQEFVRHQGSSPADLHLLLADPTVSELEDALGVVASQLANDWRKDAIWGAEFGFAFSGHGERDGTICLKDGTFDVATIFPDIVPPSPSADSSRLMGRLFLDSCYAGAAICQSLGSLPRSVSLRDAYAAALHDEEASEFDELQHGLMTYVARNPTPLHRQGELVRELLEAGAWELEDGGRPRPVNGFDYPDGLAARIRVSLIGFEMVPFLSGDGQHVLDVMNTRIVTVKGRGHLDLSEEFGGGKVDAEHLCRLLEDLTRKPLDLGIRIGSRAEDEVGRRAAFE